MLNKKQIILIQTAVRKAGLRTAAFDGRYRLLLKQYLQPNGEPVTSCKQLNNSQLDDMLAICESLGWAMPGEEADHYRKRVANKYDTASFGQQAAIKHLAADLGLTDLNLNSFIRRMSGTIKTVAVLSPKDAYKIIEALKAMLTRKTGQSFENVKQIKNYYGDVTDGKENKTPQE